MKKRSLTILFVLLLLLIPTTLAYWIQVNPPESVTSNVEIKVDYNELRKAITFDELLIGVKEDLGEIYKKGKNARIG